MNESSKDIYDKIGEIAKKVVDGLPTWMKKCEERDRAEYMRVMKARKEYEAKWRFEE